MTPTPNTPEAPQEGLVEAARRVASAVQQVEHRNGPNGVIRVHLADAKALLAALTPSPVQSSPGEVERLLLVSWFDGMAAVVGAAWCAADSSSDDFDPETCVSIPMGEMQKLSDAIDALEGLVPAGHTYVGTGALNDDVRAALTPPSSPGAVGPDVTSIADVLASWILDDKAVWEAARGVHLLFASPSSPASAEVGGIVERIAAGELENQAEQTCPHERSSEGGGLGGFCLDCGDDLMVRDVEAFLASTSSPSPALRLAEEALKPFARAHEGIQERDPDYPPHGAALRGSFDWWVRTGDDWPQRRAVTRADITRAAEAYATIRAAQGKANG